jgi:7-cyano-7-deazaguanine synthase
MSGGARKAVVLLSGGADSATTLAVARREGFRTFTMSFDYGQRHGVELKAANRIAERMGVERHQVVTIDLRAFGGSALTDDLEVPKGRSQDEMTGEIPITYVPARNIVFLSYALAWAETLGASDLFIGVTAVDYSGYPDCRPEFIEAYERMANLGTKRGVEGWKIHIHTPLIRLSKREILRLGLDLGVPFEDTHSCYDPSPSGGPCGACDSCTIRMRAFAELGLQDPVLLRG